MDNVETLYPLTPMQHGMLLRALRAAQPGEYVEQVGWTVRGGYDPGAFERAWALIGMSVFLGMRYGIWQDDLSAEQVADEAIDLVSEGLRTRGP